MRPRIFPYLFIHISMDASISPCRIYFKWLLVYGVRKLIFRPSAVPAPCDLLQAWRLREIDVSRQDHFRAAPKALWRHSQANLSSLFRSRALVLITRIVEMGYPQNDREQDDVSHSHFEKGGPPSTIEVDHLLNLN